MGLQISHEASLLLQSEHNTPEDTLGRLWQEIRREVERQKQEVERREQIEETIRARYSRD